LTFRPGLLESMAYSLKNSPISASKDEKGQAGEDEKNVLPSYFYFCGTNSVISDNHLLSTNDYRRPMKPFFCQNPKLLGLGQQFKQIHFGAFGVFSANLSAPILLQRVPCPCFQLINHYFYKKLSLYIQIPNICLGLGFEFGPQKIRDLASVCL
jgi:hypothetical protein